MIKLLKKLFGRKPAMSEPELTDEQRYNRWKYSQDTPEIPPDRHPVFDAKGRRIPGAYAEASVTIELPAGVRTKITTAADGTVPRALV